MAEEIAKGNEELTVEEQFDDIMSNYGNDILQLTYSYVKNVTIAEDLTQEIFVKCYFNVPKFKRKLYEKN